MAAALDDRSLVLAAQAGDRDAMDQLLRRHFDRIHAVCRRITGNEADAADAAQEALIAVVRGLQRFDGRSAFSTWVYRVATNASLDELRRRRRRPIASVDRDHHDPHDDHAPRRTEAADPAAERPIDMVAERMATDAALAGLAEEFRVPVVLRDVADLDYAEIAEVLGVPIGTVKSRIARGRGMLAGALGRTGNRGATPERPTGAS
ncbi:MAG: sigma-70 family RNA polymerase sigma factor [Ilumatobacteraceae bacterium]|nr:sigma-70 family RNA polymerase sigma factor [Ilumatobacter sp.]MCB0983126.1 sigma-70 family RNA polymerase sigma factor [Ilumatobacter sp.]